MADDLSAALRCLTLSSEDDSITISYLQNLARSRNIDICAQLEGEIPAIWPILVTLKDSTEGMYLPTDVSSLVLILLKIRKDTFSKSPIRYEDDYIPWFDPADELPSTQLPEHPSMCYPTLPLLCFPKKYRVSRQVDSDYCAKSFNSHSSFSNGIFSVGCSCEFNITFGFELLIERESAHNLFRFLMCRDRSFLSQRSLV